MGDQRSQIKAMLDLSSTDPRVRVETIVGIEDQAVLAEVAAKDPSPAVRATAISKITTQSTLRNSVLHDPDTRVQKAALARITDPQILAEIAMTPGAWAPTRRTAASLLADQALLLNVARLCELWDVRCAAIERIQDVAALQELAATEWDRTVQQALRDRLHVLGAPTED